MEDVDQHICTDPASAFTDYDDPLLFLDWTPNAMATEIASVAVGSRPML